jgi:hypothetical protein
MVALPCCCVEFSMGDLQGIGQSVWGQCGESGRWLEEKTEMCRTGLKGGGCTRPMSEAGAGCSRSRSGRKNTESAVRSSEGKATGDGRVLYFH